MVDRCVRIECFVRGYRVYKSQWRPDLGDMVETKLEEFNKHDRYAVAVVDTFPEKYLRYVITSRKEVERLLLKSQVKERSQMYT